VRIGSLVHACGWILELVVKKTKNSWKNVPGGGGLDETPFEVSNYSFFKSIRFKVSESYHSSILHYWCLIVNYFCLFLATILLFCVSRWLFSGWSVPLQARISRMYQATFEIEHTPRQAFFKMVMPLYDMVQLSFPPFISMSSLSSFWHL
jgi:hypothetical protein